MSRRGIVLLLLLVMVVACGGLSLATHGLRVAQLRSLGEVTAVVEGDRPGTVIVRTGRSSWRVDDTGEIDARAQEAPIAEPRATQCLGRTCYRADTTALRVEVSDDGGATYRTAWEVAGAAYDRLVASYPDAADLASRSLVVHPTGNAGHVVFVANGRDGLLYRDPTGDWRRLGFPASGEGCCFYEPAPPIEPRSATTTVIVAGVGAVTTMLAAAITALISRRRRWRDIPVIAAIAALVAYGCVVSVRFPDVGMFPGILYGAPVLLFTVVSGAALAAVYVSGRPRARR